MKKFNDAKVLLFFAFTVTLCIAVKTLPTNSLTWEEFVSYLMLFAALLKTLH